IFQRFHRGQSPAARSHEGSGIGLALSRGWRRAWRAAAAHPAPHALPRHLNPRQDGASATGRGPARSNP
ncbi:ATP-binding protein, partial [Achromobacter xylosoxidans]|uniref:hypothetical protein n=1 Tax=Alcaligenes xylosoxydans xylosoxydans TaxID=85698 RepID=UPI002ACA2B38